MSFRIKLHKLLTFGSKMLQSKLKCVFVGMVVEKNVCLSFGNVKNVRVYSGIIQNFAIYIIMQCTKYYF